MHNPPNIFSPDLDVQPTPIKKKEYTQIKLSGLVWLAILYQVEQYLRDHKSEEAGYSSDEDTAELELCHSDGDEQYFIH